MIQILKYVLFLLSQIIPLAGTYFVQWTEPHPSDPARRRLTKWGRVALPAALLAFCMALILNVLDEQARRKTLGAARDETRVLRSKLDTIIRTQSRSGEVIEVMLNLLRTEDVQGILRANSELRQQVGTVISPLVEAAFGCKESDSLRLLQSGYGVNTVSKATGTTPLSAAALNDCLSLVELFLSYGAEPDIPDDHGDTPLLAATQNKSEKAVDLLLRKKANPNAENNRGYTPLRWAALSGNTALVARLLDGGAEPNRASEFDGVTPVHAVALQSKCPNQEHLAVVALLHEKGASCDTKDKNGRAPMDYALSWNCPTFVEALLRCDAPAAGNMQDGQSYMEFAEAKGFREITRLLRSHR